MSKVEAECRELLWEAYMVWALDPVDALAFAYDLKLPLEWWV
jgi:hypothetical protein